MMQEPTYKKAFHASFCSALMAFSMTAMSVQAKTYTSVPKVMQGTWSASSAKYCKRNDPTKLTITAKKLQFWETRAKVSNVTKKGNYVTVSLKMTGEGETWYEKKHFLLKNNNKELVGIINKNTEFVRYRCIER